MKKSLILAAIVIMAFCSADLANAMPSLQTYISGAAYKQNFMGERDTWFSAAQSFELKTVSAWNNGNGNKARDVWLVIGTLKGENGQVYINGQELAGLDAPSFGVPSSVTISDPGKNMTLRYYHLGTANNDSRGLNHYDHGNIYGTNKWGTEFGTQIEVVGFSHVHFDAVSQDMYGRKKIRFSPGSHDASYGSQGHDNPVPEPGTLALLGTGLLSMIPVLRKKRKLG